MPTAVPQELQKHGLSRFIDKAEELETFQPIVSYWCYYYVVQKVLQDGLHKESAECDKYANGLLDKLESFRKKLEDQDEITDEQEARRYVLEFAGAVLDRANLQINSNTVTQRTVHALRASYTFFELLEIWSAVTPEVAAKIKYAKYHAVRILKAIQAGQDPNLTNPTPPTANTPRGEEEEEYEEEEEDAGEASEKGQGNQGHIGANHQPYVADDDEDEDYERSRASGAAKVSRQKGTKVSADDSISQANSIPSPTSPHLPSTNPTRAVSRSGKSEKGSVPKSAPSHSPATISPSSQKPQGGRPKPGRTTPSFKANSNLKRQVPPSASRANFEQLDESDQNDNNGDLTEDDEDGEEFDPEVVSQAQKHSKWAVSALDFNDINTATRELKTALRLLQGLRATR